jgi:ubiquinone/menaquinone biosynthesis C-methylase UbiE
VNPEVIRDVNVRYHDVAAREYDAKWGVSFEEVGRDQVLGKLRKALGRRPGPFARSLEVGAGTGYFSLNLVREGVIGDATCTDISPGMVDALRANAARLGVEVDARVADAERLPFPDSEFDLVLGHAVLHHLPDLDAAFAEFHRVLRPGGWIVFAGEPSRRGDRLAAVPKRLALRAAPLWRSALRVSPAAGTNGGGPGGPPDDHALEPFVDVHAFTPDELAARARGAGFVQVRVRGEELLANWFGWANRTLEATADPATIPWLWTQYAYRGYLLLQRVDEYLLESRLPPAVFYNLMLAGMKD